MVAVWWIYHAVLTFAGWYGFNGGIPAFSVGWAWLVSCCSSACSPSDPDRSGQAYWPTAPGTRWSSRTSPHPVRKQTGFSLGAGICSVSSPARGSGHVDSRRRIRLVAFPLTTDGLSSEAAGWLPVAADVAVFRNTPKLKTTATAT